MKTFLETMLFLNLFLPLQIFRFHGFVGLFHTADVFCVTLSAVFHDD